MNDTLKNCTLVFPEFGIFKLYGFNKYYLQTERFHVHVLKKKHPNKADYFDNPQEQSSVLNIS